MMNKTKIMLVRETGMLNEKYMNYGMGIIATILDESYNVRCIDNNGKYKRYDQNELLAMIEEYDPSIVGLSVGTLNSLTSYQLVKKLKEKFPDKVIVAGGRHVSHEFAEALENGIDFVIRGEAELIIHELMDKISSAGFDKDLSPPIDLKGIVYCRKGTLVENGICPVPEKIDNYLVDYSLFNEKDFYRNLKDSDVYSTILTSRGCPFKCTFCSDIFSRTRVRSRSVDSVLSELKDKVKKYKLNYVTIWDADFTLNKKYAVEFCNTIIKEGLSDKVNFAIQSDSYRVLDINMLSLMKKAGISYFSLGIERLSIDDRNKIKKPLKQEIIMENLNNLTNVGFIVNLNFLYGLPFETMDTLYEEKNNFLKVLNEKANVVSTNVLVPMPGTKDYTDYPEIHKWYLNDNFYQGKPFYIDFMQWFIDFNEFSFYGFDKKIRKEFLNMKHFFRIKSMEKKSKIYPLIYRVGIVFSNLSKVIYKISPKTERFFFSKFVNSYKMILAYAVKWFQISGK